MRRLSFLRMKVLVFLPTRMPNEASLVSQNSPCSSDWILRSVKGMFGTGFGTSFGRIVAFIRGAPCKVRCSKNQGICEGYGHYAQWRCTMVQQDLKLRD